MDICKWKWCDANLILGRLSGSTGQELGETRLDVFDQQSQQLRRSESGQVEVGLREWEEDLGGRFQGEEAGKNTGLETGQRQTIWFGRWTSYLTFVYLHEVLV